MNFSGEYIVSQEYVAPKMEINLCAHELDMPLADLLLAKV
jgi:hypothetical protein